MPSLKSFWDGSVDPVASSTGALSSLLFPMSNLTVIPAVMKRIDNQVERTMIIVCRIGS